MTYDASVPAAKRHLAGWQTGFRVLPYRMQDRYGRTRHPIPFKAVVLENDFLRATFLPELGGRLYSLYAKAEGRELLACNPVFQPANLAIRNAWFSGGIEWNAGQYGHAFSTCSPVFAARIADAAGNPGVRLYDYERCKGIVWQIDFYLPPASPVLVAHCRVVNPNRRDTSLYWWTNIAVPERPGVRVLAPGTQAIYVDFSQAEPIYGMGDLPRLPGARGADASYATNFGFASEYFFQLDGVAMPWEAAVDEQGRGFFEASTDFLRYRKMFCWGMHPGGRHWQEFLSEPGNDYLEIQGGLAPTQLHGLVMPAGAAWEWVQVFGALQMDPARAHDPDFAAAARHTDEVIRNTVTPDQLAAQLHAGRAQADAPPAELLHLGTGWGALEAARRAQAGEPRSRRPAPSPPPPSAPSSTPGSPCWKPGVCPRPIRPACRGRGWCKTNGWPCCGMPRPRTGCTCSTKAWRRMEHGDTAGALAAWEASLQEQPSAWAWRNLAVARQRRGEPEAALACYREAWALASRQAQQSPALAVECLQALVAAGEFAEAHRLYESLPAALQADERIQILRGRVALALDQLDVVAAVLEREYAVIREGETELTDLWTELWVRRAAAETGRTPDETLRAEVLAAHPPPAHHRFSHVLISDS